MKKILIAFLFILTATISFAILETDKKICLEEAIELALKTNPELELSRLNFEIAKDKIKEAGRFQNPDLEFMQNIPKAGKGNPNTIGIEQTIELFKRNKRKKVEKSLSELTLNNHDFLKQALIFEVKRAYINLLTKKTNLKTIQELEALSNELYETMKTEGNKEIELMQAKIAANKASLLVNNAKLDVISAQNYFNAVLNTSDINFDTEENYLNNDYSKMFSVSPMASTPSFEAIKNYALNNRSDLLAAKKEVEAKKLQYDVIKNKRIPDLKINGGYAYQTKGMAEDNKFQSGGYVGVSLINIPILYNYGPEINMAEIEIKKAELKYKDIEIDAIRSITDAYEKYIISKENLNFYNENILKDSKEFILNSKKSFENREIDVVSFLVSKKVYLDLILGYNEALGDYYISFAELIKELNIDELNFENI